MRGERPLRFGASGWLIVVAFAVFAALLASAAMQTAPAKTPWEMLASGQSVPLRPQTVDLQPREIAPESVTIDYTVEDTGERTPSPFGGPGPSPTDAPFGAEIKVHVADADAQTEPSVASDSAGATILVAYTDAITPTNRDVVVARSTDGGGVWTRIVVAGSGAYNEFDPRVVQHGTRWFVFFSMDDAAVPRAFRYAVSTNAGQTWTVQTLNYGASAPFRDLRSPDASSYNGQFLYAVYETFCDVPATCGTVSQAMVTILYDATGTVVPPSIYFPFGIDTIEPAIWANQDQTVWVSDIDASDPGIGGNPGDHDIVWIQSVTGQNTAASWGQAFITGLFSTDIVRADASGFFPFFNLPYQLINNAQGFPNHAIVNLWSDDSGLTWTLDLTAGAAGTEFKDPAAFASSPLFHVTYYMGGDLGYAYTLDLVAGFPPAIKVNSNTGTIVDQFRSNDIWYGGGVRVAFQDTRDGSSDVWYTDFSGFAFYIFDKNPRQGTIDIDGSPTAVPTAFLWATGGAHTAVCPTPDPGPAGVRYVFSQWSDFTTNPSKAITVGSADVTLVCIYNTEYFLTISTTVGTTTPTSGWYAAGAPVSIQWNSPAPGACVRYNFGGWTGSGPGSYTGIANPTTISMNGPVTEVAAATREFCFTIDTSPSGILQVTIDGTTLVAPQTVWWAEGSSHTVTAISPQSPGNPDQRFVFTSWADGPTTATRTIVATAAANYTARYNLEYQLRVIPTPADCDFIVDGTTYTSPQTLWYLQGSAHNVDVPQPQLVTADTRYQFGSWSDGGAKSHSVTLAVPLSLDLTCTVEYRHVFDTNPTGLQLVIDGGAAVPAPQTLWWASGSTHTVEFTSPQPVGPDSRRVFAQWSDASMLNPRSFSVSAPATLTVQTAIEHRIRFDTVPGGVGIIIRVNGSPITTPGEAWLRETLPATIDATSPSLDPSDPTGTRYVWSSWSDGGLRQHTIVVVAPATYTATYGTEYFLDVESPYGNVLNEGWYAAGTTAFAAVDVNLVSGTTGTQYLFVQWTGAASGTNYQQSSAITMNAPRLVTAQWKTQYFLTVVTPYGTGGGQGWYDAGTTATASLNPTTVAGPTGTQYVFTSWTGGATGTGATSDPITMDAPKTATAQWKTQYLLTIFPAPPSGVTVTQCPSAPCWYDAGATVTLSMSTDGIESVPGQTRLGFIRWIGDAIGTDWQTSSLLTMNGPKTVGSEWLTQHKLTLVGDLGGVTQTNADGWYTAGTVATLTAQDPYSVPTETGVRHAFVSWTGAAAGTSPVTTVTMDAPKTVNVNWQRQVLVTVTTNPGITAQATIDGNPVDASGVWINEGDTIQIVIGAEVQSGGKTYKFVSWNGATGGASTTLTVNEPTDLVAQYREAGLFENPAVIGGIIAAVIAALLLLFFLMRRRKGEPEDGGAAAAGRETGAALPPPPPSAAGTMECPSCGMTIEAKSGPCPICGAEVVAPTAPAKDERTAKLEEAYKTGRITKEQYQANLRRLRGT